MLDLLPHPLLKSFQRYLPRLKQPAGQDPVVFPGTGKGRDDGRVQGATVDQEVDETLIFQTGVRKEDHSAVKVNTLAHLGARKGQDAAALREEEVAHRLRQRRGYERPIHWDASRPSMKSATTSIG